MYNMITRRPIFNLELKVVAYHLDFRYDPNLPIDNNCSPDQSASKIINEMFILQPFPKLTGGVPGIVSFSRKMLISGVAELFPAEHLYIELANNLTLDNTLYLYCEKLLNQEFTFELQNFTFRPSQMSFLPIVSWVKISSFASEYLKRQAPKKLHQMGKLCVAERVNTKARFDEMAEYGYDLFEGNFILEPPVKVKDTIYSLPANIVSIIQEINSKEINLDRFEDIIKRDPSLSFKLLRLVNSAAFGFQSKIVSVRQALTILGQKEIKKWILLFVLGDIGSNKTLELLKISLCRAKFLELITPDVGQKQNKNDFYLAGLFSLLDVFFEQPLPTLLKDLPISDVSKSILLNKSGLEADLLHLIIFYEKGDWEEIDRIIKEHQLSKAHVTQFFTEALIWADNIIEQKIY